MHKTPIYECHKEQNALMAEFANTLLPVRFSTEQEEYNAVRNHVGMFDVSHMGEFIISGSDADNFLQYMLSNDLSKLKNNQSQYTLLLNKQGGIIDDLIAYKMQENKYLLCVNAANIQKDWHWLCEHAYAYSNLTLENVSDNYAQIALQGPNTFLLLQKLGFSKNIAKFSISDFTYLNKQILIARTGYTGEKYGVEIFVTPDNAAQLWKDLLLLGAEFNIKPCGLSVRDSLRIEAGLLLHGQDMSLETSAANVDLMNFVNLQKNFIAKESLQNTKKSHKLIGFTINDKAIARHGYQVFDHHSQLIGHVTSATFIPAKSLSIGFAYIFDNSVSLGESITINIRNRSSNALVCKRNFLH